MEILYNESDDYLVDSIFYLFKVTILYYIVSYCNVLCYVMLCYFMLSHIMLSYFMLCYIILDCIVIKRYDMMFTSRDGTR